MSALERNLERLLRHSYVCARPSALLRSRLQATLEAELAPRHVPTASEDRATLREKRPRALSGSLQGSLRGLVHSRTWLAAAVLTLALLGALAWQVLGPGFGSLERSGSGSPDAPLVAHEPTPTKRATRESREPVDSPEARDAAQLSALEQLGNERRAAQQDEETSAVAAQPPAARRAGLHGSVVRASDDSAVSAYELVYWPLVDLPRVGEPSLQIVHAPDGAFALPEVPPGRYHVLLRAPGLASHVVDGIEVPLAEPLRIALESGGSVRGRVLDASGAPLAGAVVLSTALAPSPVLPVRPELLPATLWGGARSNADGSFELRDIPAGSPRLLVFAAGHAPRSSDPLAVVGGAESLAADIALSAGGRLHGRIERDDGAAWPGVRVLASSMNFDGTPMLYDLDYTDERGRYALEHLPAGPYIVMHFGAAAEEGSAPVALLPSRVRAGESTQLDFVDRSALLTLTGRVLGQDGRPAALYSLSIGRRQDGADSWKSATTDADGVYSFRGLEAGRWELLGGRNMALSMSRIGEVELAGSGEVVHDVALPSNQLRGSVLADADGAPLARSVLILLADEGVGAAPAFRGKCLTDAQGQFEFAALEPGRYFVWSITESGRHATARSAWIMLVQGANAELPPLRCGPAGSAEVRVIDATGAAVEGARIAITNRAGEELPLALDQRTDTRGVFRARGLAPGVWMASATDASGRRVESELRIEADLDSPVELVLGPR